VTIQTREPGVKPGPVRAEQVGSLLRPAPLLAAIGFDAREAQADTHAALLEGEVSEREALTRLEDLLISEAIERQIATGIGVVSDGEFRRLLYTASFYSSVTGFEPSGRSMTFHTGGGKLVETAAHPIVARRLEKVASPPSDEAKFVASATDALFKVTIPAASKFLIPGVFRPGVTDGAYADQDQLQAHIVEIDTYLVDPDRRALLDAEGIDAEGLLDRCIEADRAVIADIPDDVYTAIHICRGNFRSMWMYQGALDPVAEQMFGELPYDSFLIEWDDIGRDGDYSALRFLPRGRVAALGIVSSKSPTVETPDALLAEIELAGRYADVEQLALCPQCGFASDAGGNAIDEHTQWTKLELVAQTAEAVWPNG
jgi:5-methyltetrahydropteroyltriglutamate--homocysteine methyltransferase